MSTLETALEPTLELMNAIDAAYTRLAPHIRKTPLWQSKALSDRCGNKVYLKAENLQYTGAFKVRGALNKMLDMDPGLLESGVICASAGNHAQGVAYAASMLGIPATIVMPKTTPRVKVNATKKLGGHVLLHGNCFDEANERATFIRDHYGLTEIHPFNDWDVMAGQGTVALELMSQLPNCDMVLVPVGGGGLLAGVLAALKGRYPHVRIVGVEPLGACAMFKSFHGKHLIKLDKVNTKAEGAAVKCPGDKTYDVISKLCDDIVVVSEEAIEEAVWQLMRDEKLVVEYAGALSVAALRTLAPKGKTICCLVTGGNIDGATIAATIASCNHEPIPYPKEIAL